jgi:hypothetical protein
MQYDLFVSTVLSEYERNNYKEHVGNDIDKLVLANDKETSLQEAKAGLHQLVGAQEFGLILAGLGREEREIAAFLEAIEVKGEYETTMEKVKARIRALEADLQNINAGKFSLASKIKNLSKDEELALNDRETKAAVEELNYVSMICDVSTALLAGTGVEAFKQQRRANYYSLLRTFLHFERTVAEKKICLWDAVLRVDTVALQSA